MRGTSHYPRVGSQKDASGRKGKDASERKRKDTSDRKGKDTSDRKGKDGERYIRTIGKDTSER